MDNLSDLLIRTEDHNFDRGMEFELDIIPSFCKILGVDQDYLFFQQNIGEGLRPDGVIQINPNEESWMVVEVKYSSNPQTINYGVKKISHYIHNLSSEYGVLIGVGHIIVQNSEGEIIFEATRGDEDLLEEIQQTLTPPEKYRTPGENIYGERERTNAHVSNPFYEIDLEQLEKLLNRVDQAEGTREKGESFEEFAEFLFGAVQFLEIRNRNLSTNTGEIDLVIEYTGSEEMTIFDEWCRFVLVECKNWSGSVGVSQVRDFKGKMDKAKVDIGIIFARNGISGDEGANALRWIHDYFQREGRMILVISDRELDGLLTGKDFYEMIDELMYQRRFDFK